jgi:tetratricopeptide (TPR) repeat protein
MSHSCSPGRPPLRGPRPFTGRWARLAAVALCLAGLGVAAFLLRPRLAAAYHRHQGRLALQQHDLAGAREHLRRCLAAEEGSGEAHFLMARACRRDGDLDSARHHLDRARRLGRDGRQVELEFLLLQAQAGAVPPVEEALGRYLAAGAGDEPDILEALARGCLQGNLVDRAFQYTSRWVDHHPEDWNGWYWHGRALEQGLRYDLAAEAYQAVLARKPGHLDAQLHRGQVLLRSGHYPEALPLFESYTRRRPGEAAGLLGLAGCQRSTGQTDEARATLDRLFALPGDHPDGWLLRGRLELDAGRPADALSWLERAGAFLPKDRDANQALAVALRWLDRAAEARAYEERRREIDEDLRRVDQLSKEILANPGDVELRYEAGATLARLGRDADAARWFVSALLLEPGHRPTRKALAECIERLGDPHLADAYRPVLADEPPERGPPLGAPRVP